MDNHPHGWLSLLPPIVAILLAIVTRRVVLSLLAGILVGTLILTQWHLPHAVTSLCQEHVWPTLIDEDKLHVFFFTMLMGAMVGIVNRCGGMRGMVQWVSPWAGTRRRGQLATWGLGLFVFFDDYANTMLLGNTLRPLTDRLKISREKLAYLVDSTAAPVSGLALVSTWVAGEIQFVQDGLDKVPEAADWTAFGVFLHSIPYRFYVLWALAFVPLVAWLGRDFGPMLVAERRCARGRSGQAPGLPAAHSDLTQPDPDTPARWWNAALPIGLTVGVIVWLMYRSGRAAFDTEAHPSLMEVFGQSDAYGSLLWGALVGALAAATLSLTQRLLSGRQALEAAGNGARMMIPALAILWLASALSAMTGNKPSAHDQRQLEVQTASARAVAAALLEAHVAPQQALRPLVQAGVPATEAAALWSQARGREPTDAEALVRDLAAAGYTADQVDRALIADGLPIDEAQLLTARLASAFPEAGTPAEPAYPHAGYRLYTGGYLGALLRERLPVFLLPTVIFVLSAGVAFATGTSWGTMGIVMPLAIPLVVGVLSASGQAVGPDVPILLGAVGGVLAGAIFGDHCSPISDTTVLSSQASGCDHVAHVWTQLPYALVVGGVAIVFGTLPIGLGVSVWVMQPIGLLALYLALRVLGRPVEAHEVSRP